MTGLAQEPSRPEARSPVADFIAQEEGAVAEAGPPADAFPDLPDVSGIDALDPETREAALDAVREYYRYRQSGYEHRRRVFEWQLQSSRIIFWVVILMVSAGIYFSGVQFHIALRSPGTRPASAAVRTEALAEATREEAARVSAGEPAAPGEEVPHARGLYTSLEAGRGGIKVSSPVLGVIILIISFLFFYMYLVHVYPISEIM